MTIQFAIESIMDYRVQMQRLGILRDGDAFHENMFLAYESSTIYSAISSSRESIENKRTSPIE